MKRSSWHIRANAIVGFWLLAAAVVAITHRFVPADLWLMVHLVLLGAVSTAILIWSQHFSQTLLRSPNPAGRRGEAARLAIHTGGAALVVTGMVTGIWPLTLSGGIFVGGNALWHALSILQRKRRALPARFSHLVRYYLVAALILPVGVSLGVWLANGGLAAADHARVYIGHVSLNLLGWVGLTVLGTLVTLWPTSLRTQLHEGAEKQARRALPILAGALALMQVSLLVSLPVLMALAVAIYLAGMALIYVPAVITGWRKRPGNFATLSLGASGLWLAGCVATFGVFGAVGSSWGAIADSLSSLTAPFVVGFGAQVLLGALSYLLPVVLGGGPKVVRRTTAIMDGAGPARILMVNVGLGLCLLAVPSLVRVALSLVAFIGLLLFLPKAVRAVVVARRGVAGLPSDESAPAKPAAVPAAGGAHGGGVAGREQSSGVSAQKSPLGSFLTGAATIVLAIAVGVAGDPAAVGLGANASDETVTATGEVTEVTVEMRDMRFYPDSIDVPVGDQLLITVVNTDDQVHDLVLDTGDASGRLGPGGEETIDVGVVGRDIDGWCSVAGHRQMGMVFDINVTGQADAQDEVARNETGNSDAGSKTIDIDLAQEPESDFAHFDPTVPPAEEADGAESAAGPVTHEVTLEVTEEVKEVAPGVKQTVWQFGDSAPGPTLRGKVGDVFEITLVNDGTLGHSIDFHAGMLAPNEPMRTIAPGETLTYKFTAEHSGIWMYHCATTPMSLHIANGMFGAVIIDPPDLDQVDHEFLMIQSEMYLGAQSEVGDLEKIQADNPDLVVFNGYANQYVYDPIEVGVGDRVRVWVMPVGPNRGTSFHVIGGQFDTVFHEGRYRLRAGETSGASQALGLTTAQGGFVELTFPEIGDYPFVDHTMINAERGASGLFSVR